MAGVKKESDYERLFKDMYSGPTRMIGEGLRTSGDVIMDIPRGVVNLGKSAVGAVSGYNIPKTKYRTPGHLRDTGANVKEGYEVLARMLGGEPRRSGEAQGSFDAPTAATDKTDDTGGAAQREGRGVPIHPVAAKFGAPQTPEFTNQSLSAYSERGGTDIPSYESRQASIEDRFGTGKTQVQRGKIIRIPDKDPMVKRLENFARQIEFDIFHSGITGSKRKALKSVNNMLLQLKGGPVKERELALEERDLALDRERLGMEDRNIASQIALRSAQGTKNLAQAEEAGQAGALGTKRIQAALIGDILKNSVDPLTGEIDERMVTRQYRAALNAMEGKAGTPAPMPFSEWKRLAKEANKGKSYTDEQLREIYERKYGPVNAER